jgi:hypothetical protein
MERMRSIEKNSPKTIKSNVMKKLIIVLMFLAGNALLSQNNTTPCTAQDVACLDKSITGIPNMANQFGLAPGPSYPICSQISTRPTLFYRVTISVAGMFTFLIRPGTDVNNNGVVDDPAETAHVDYDWAVWKNTDCQNLTTITPVRLSFDGPPSYVTGLVVPPANGLCEGSSGTGLLDGFPVNAGDVLIIAVNFYSTGGQIPPFQLVIGGTYGGGGNAVYAGILYDLTDGKGNIKTTFCLDEDVFISGFGGKSNTFDIELLPDVVNTPIASFQVSPGSVNGFNVTRRFREEYGINFQPGITYRIRLKIKGACGCYEVTRGFVFECCVKSADAAFNINITNQVLTGESTVDGEHTWEVYKMSPTDGTILSSIATTHGNGLSLDAPEGPCYFIKHNISNACGSNCASQRFCSFDCAEKECNLQKPKNVIFDPATGHLTWDLIPGVSYVVQITGNGCCGINIISAADVFTINTDNPEATLDLPQSGGPYECYNIIVYALCPDGSSSMISDPICYTPSGQRSSFLSGIAETGQQGSISLKLMPNPAKESVSIILNSIIDTKCYVTILDVSGRIVKQFDPVKTSEGGSVLLLNTSQLSKGIYLVKVLTHERQVINQQLIIE